MHTFYGFVAIMIWIAFGLICWMFSTPEVRYQPMAAYELRGDGKSNFSRDKPTVSKEACLKEARRKYRSANWDLVWGEIENPPDGTSAPFHWGCEIVDSTGRPTGQVLR
jgi:hypothetical protein